MEKIPTLFVRDEKDRSYTTDEVTPGCEWVLRGEGQATRKYDGTCVMFDGEAWWARREVKKGKRVPDNFQELNYDPVTEKRMGWIPIEDSDFYKLFREACALWMVTSMADRVGTYELCGPKINANNEQFIQHVLIKHSDAEKIWFPLPPLTAEQIMTKVYSLAPWEGVVWQHPDGRMAKMKVRDLR